MTAVGQGRAGQAMSPQILARQKHHEQGLLGAHKEPNLDMMLYEK